MDRIKYQSSDRKDGGTTFATLGSGGSEVIVPLRDLKFKLGIISFKEAFGLNDKHMETLYWTAEGLSIKMIADRMNEKESTIHRRRDWIYKRLYVMNGPSAVKVFCLKGGYNEYLNQTK